MRPPLLRWLAAYFGLSTLIWETSARSLADQGGEACRKTEVAILGAGITGITAAQALTNSSITDFIIVDRNDYVGVESITLPLAKSPINLHI